MASVEQKAKIEFLEDVEVEETRTGEVLVDERGEIQRLPVPSSDPNDPLNYTKWEKLGVIFSCCWFCKSLLVSHVSTAHTIQRSCPCR
jgi:hypothetical protein